MATTIDATNGSIGAAKDAVLDELLRIMDSKDMTAGQKSAALLEAQAKSGIVDGVMNVLSKTYNKFGQIGQ